MSAQTYAPIEKKSKRDDLEPSERAILLERLKKMRQRAMQGESERRAVARRGAKLAKGKMWEEGITQGRLPITANQAIAMGELFVSQILRGDPVPELQPINGADDDAAALLEGGLITSWRRQRMLSRLKSSMRLSFFSFPCLQYTFWDSEAVGGSGRVIGNTQTRTILPHNTIIDNRSWFVKDMEFVGIRETMSRAKLCMLFPDKAEEIEDAAIADETERPGTAGDPWDSPQRKGPPGQVSRLVADKQGNFTAKTTIKVGGTRKATPMSEEIEAEFMWYRDPTPEEIESPKLTTEGKPVMRHTRDENGELQFEHKGWDVVHDPERGPVYQPKLEPSREIVMEKNIVKKYPRWRHIAWLPGDDIILWDVNWDGPCPLWATRTTYPLNEFHGEGQGLRLASLSIARNILYTIIFQRLKLSLGGTWIASHKSGLKRNKLTPEEGQVFYAKNIGTDDIRQFPTDPLDVSYINVLHEIEAEMMKLIGMSPVQRGQAAGRADSSATYEKLIEQGGTAVVDVAQLLEESLHDWAEIEMWYMQNYYTHEHFVEVEAADGLTEWRQASKLAMQGEFATRIDTSPMAAHSESAIRDLAKEGAQLGIYTLPMLAKMGRYPQWRRALKQKVAMTQNPAAAPLLGPAGAPPGQHPPASGARSHHKPKP